jgi:hypothetical protein
MFTSSTIWSETVVTYRSPESKQDRRYDYDYEVLKLALENTLESHGGYKLERSPAVNFKRAMHLVLENKLPNFFYKSSYADGAMDGLHYIRFPVDLGVVGYRVCFARKSIIKALGRVKTLEDLKSYSIGQGIGWLDRKILRDAGLTVVEAPYQGLFRMTASGRVDLFCRGINEVSDELETHKNIEALALEESFSIVYPLPRFFFTSPENKLVADRVQEGIEIAYQNGTLLALWNKAYGYSIEYSKLSERRIFRIENSMITGLSDEYRKYLYVPMPD